MTTAHTASRQTFLTIREFLNSYVTFPDPTYADICALWAMATHVYRRFDSFGYLVITASTKRAGKSVLAECIACMSHAPKVGTSRTAAVMRTLVAKGHTMFFDEAESLNSESASAMREYINIGYRAGQEIDVTVGFGETVSVPAYGPKAFILIGDVNDTMRDRSININLSRARAPQVYRYSVAKAQAELTQGATDGDNGDSDLTHLIDAEFNGEIFDANDIPMLEGREAEVWTPVLSLARQFCPDRMNDIIACAVNLASLKMTTEKRRFSEIRKTAEGQATDDTFTNFAMTDLQSIFSRKEDKVFTHVAIERMKAIATSPWRTYKGEGLTPDLLFALVKVHGLTTKSVRIGSSVKRGFYRKDVGAAFKRMGKE